MRAILGMMAAALVLTACEERHLRGIVGTPAGTGSATVRILLEDDPAGAEPVTSLGARPTVALRFSVAMVRSGLEASVPDTGALFGQVPIDSTGGDLITTTDTVPSGIYPTVRLTLTEATLAMPGATPIDLLSGSPSPSVLRDITRTIADGELVTVRVDLNSDQWLVPNPAAATGPPFLFTGTTDFLTALSITFP
jgi:hypothetical protein